LPARRKPHEETSLDLPKQPYTDPEYLEFDGVPFPHLLHLQGELLQIADGGIVDPEEEEEELAGLYAGLAGDSARVGVRHDQNRIRIPEIEAAGDGRRQIRDLHLEEISREEASIRQGPGQQRQVDDPARGPHRSN